MASYGSYKKINTDQFQTNVVTGSKLANGAGIANCVLYVYNPRALACQNCMNAGDCTYQADGFCCLWTVPANVSRVTFEIWSGGGGGAGMICCNYCSFSSGGSGGNYASKTICVCPSWQYTICAGGSWPCAKSHTCIAGMGCRSYINGCNLSNFCVMGGCGGYMCDGDAWGGGQFGYHHGNGCANCNVCGYFNADMGLMGSAGFRAGQSMCRCNGATSFTGAAPMIGKFMTTAVTEAWCSCGCYVNWPAGGGMSGTSSYCDNWAKNCAGGMGMGGSGFVKLTMA